MCSQIRISKIRISKIRISKIRISKIRISKIRIYIIWYIVGGLRGGVSGAHIERHVVYFLRFI
jgi:hypothetical protein